jgi:hypothetical protein
MQRQMASIHRSLPTPSPILTRAKQVLGPCNAIRSLPKHEETIPPQQTHGSAYTAQQLAFFLRPRSRIASAKSTLSWRGHQAARPRSPRNILGSSGLPTQSALRHLVSTQRANLTVGMSTARQKMLSKVNISNSTTEAARLWVLTLTPTPRSAPQRQSRARSPRCTSSPRCQSYHTPSAQSCIPPCA